MGKPGVIRIPDAIVPDAPVPGKQRVALEQIGMVRIADGDSITFVNLLYTIDGDRITA